MKAPEGGSHARGARVTRADFELMRVALRSLGRLRLRLVSSSMEPLIAAGDEVEVVPRPEGLERYDIVVFWDRSRLFCHYVFRLNSIPGPDGKTIVVTRGLNALREDYPVAVDCILGTVVNRRVATFDRLKIGLRDMFA